MLVLLLLVGHLVVLLVRRMRTTKRVTVSEDLVIGGGAPALESALVTALSSVEGPQYLGVCLGRQAVVLRLVAVWATAPVLLLLPVGLVLLPVRERIRLDVALYDAPVGVVVRLSGRTESVVLERVKTAPVELAPVGHAGRGPSARAAWRAHAAMRI
jgi:hypothetical protein